MNMEYLNKYISSKNQTFVSGYVTESTMKGQQRGEYCLNTIKQSSLPPLLYNITLYDIAEAVRERIIHSGVLVKLVSAVQKAEPFALCLVGRDTTPTGVAFAKGILEACYKDLMRACEHAFHYASPAEIARVSRYHGDRQDEELAPLKFHTILIVDGVIDPQCKIWAEVEQFRRRNGKITFVCSPVPVAGYELVYLDGDEPQIDLAKLGRLLSATATEHPSACKTEAVRLLESLMEKASAAATP